MPESISSANISRTAPAEWLLARVAGPDRAAAIMGDLEELAATRGRLWFWIAYARTLITLGWRTPVAFVAGSAGFFLMMSFFSTLLRNPGPNRTAHMASVDILANAAVLSTGFLLVFSVSVWFATPFAILRFGFRDRMAQLYGVFFLLAAPLFFHSNPVSLVCALLTLAVIFAALFSKPWRRPMVVIASMSIAVLVSLVACNDLATKIYHPKFHLKAGLDAASADPIAFNLVSWLVVRLTFAVALLIASFACSRLHRWLLEERPALIGGANA